MTGKITYATLQVDESVHPHYESALTEVSNELGKTHPLYINGRDVYSNSGEFVKTSPIDRRIVIGRFQRASAEHLNDAIRAVRSGQRVWESMGWKRRVEVIRNMIEVIDREKFRLAALITYEVGKNRFEALAEVFEVMDFLKYCADLMETNKGYEVPMSSPLTNEEPMSLLRPFGVFFVISPWNFPLMLLNNMATAALLMGNGVIMKPSSESPLTAVKLYRCYVEAGVPPEAVSLITGPGGEIGEQVVRSDIDGLAFTGSRDVGMNLYREFVRLQPWPKPVIAEMGSKNPVIVTARTDLERAAEGVIRGAFGFQGQKCSATSRVYVQETVFREFLELLVDKSSRLIVGDPRERRVFMGPMINAQALQKFRAAVSEAKRSGGTINYGGEVLEYGQYAHGYYVQHTVVTNLAHDNVLFKEELFVPFLLLAKYRTLDEAIRSCNDTEYGLTAGIFSDDSSEIDRFFREVEFGVCYANRRGGATTGAWPGAQSFVGWKASGTTGKGVGGPYYLLQFAREKSLTYVR
ncbi:MAG: aldehyde dehydrogenase family protein [Aigarchaeota archaeon]|nr:aldehyde dehydrogenase family protein [Aigarchaeota archaeon]MDW8092586.1 aldehyde dehydrogenase family protein [Nitrososphaerota archaeon]